MAKKFFITIGVIAVVAIGLLVWLNGSKKQKVIQLGATFPLTGEVASYGIKAKNGIQLKIDEVNEMDINKQKISIDFQDDKNSIKDAVSIFNGFANINKYPVVFGSAGSTVTEALAPISLRDKVILISPISSSSKLSTDGGKYFFRTVPSDNLQAEKLVDWVISDSIKNVAIVYTNNSWGKPLADAFSDLFKSKGGNIVVKESTPENSSDFKTIIIKLKQQKFDAIISPTYPQEGGIFVKQLKENGIKTKLYGGDNWGAPEFLNIARGAAEGTCFIFPSESKSPLWNEFVNKYKTKYGEEPDIMAAYAYDAATAIVEALKNSPTLTADDIRTQLIDSKFEGVSGNISFKENGDVISDGYGKRKVENGKIVSLNK